MQNALRLCRIALAAALAAPLSPAVASSSAQDPAPVPDTRARAVADAEQIAREMLAQPERPAELNCPKAVENARYGVETMLEVGEKNVKGGYMKVEQFDQAAAPLRALLPQLTVADCEVAEGNKRGFYQCMSSDYNHVMACGQAHPY